MQLQEEWKNSLDPCKSLVLFLLQDKKKPNKDILLTEKNIIKPETEKKIKWDRKIEEDYLAYKKKGIRNYSVLINYLTQIAYREAVLGICILA